MLKSMKNQKGFTLVEVIVVAIIVAILAAVAIPLYNGYIRDSRYNVACNLAGSICGACGATLQQGTKSQAELDSEYDRDAGDAPTVLTFPAVEAASPANVINVPKKYQVIVTTSTVQVIYDPDGKNVPSEVYTFASGPGS